jgi:hypothetical protein
MMEPTVTQSSALYFVQHKVAKKRGSFFRRFSLAGGKQWTDAPQAQLRRNLFRWPRTHWGNRD